MKIVKYEVFPLKPRWIFLRIETESGVVGWGEVISGTRTKTVVAGLHEMCERLIGRDAEQIEDIWQYLYRYFFRGGPVTMTILSGIEIALWDIKGKKYNTPIYNLLGGKVRDKLRVYSWIGGDRPTDVVSAARDKVDAGFTAVKMNATEELHYIDTYKKIEEVVERVKALRENFGYELEIAIDFHGRVHKPMVKRLMTELEPYKLMFIEEPVLPENIETLEVLYPFTSSPIAAGERVYTRWGFKHLIENKNVDIIQPDVALTGGILETRKIAAMAEAYDIAVAPHAPYGPIALAATIQVDACSPNVFIQEQSLGIHYNEGKIDLRDYLINKEIYNYVDGFMSIPTGPGLGIIMDEEKIRKMSQEELIWRNPEWRNEDGTLAEW